MISRDMVERGLLRKDILAFAEDGTDPICQMGEEWFRFGGDRDEPDDPQAYLAGLSFDELVDVIFAELEEYRGSLGLTDKEEYTACELYLRERDEDVKQPFVVKLVETYRDTVIVYAYNQEEAEEIADAMVGEGNIDLSRNCYDGLSIDACAASVEDMQDFEVVNEED